MHPGESNLPSDGVRYIGVNRLCHGVTNLFNAKKSRYREEQVNKYLSLMDSTSALSKGQCFSAMDTRHLHSFPVQGYYNCINANG